MVEHRCKQAATTADADFKTNSCCLLFVYIRSFIVKPRSSIHDSAKNQTMCFMLYGRRLCPPHLIFRSTTIHHHHCFNTLATKISLPYCLAFLSEKKLSSFALYFLLIYGHGRKIFVAGSNCPDSHQNLG